MSKLVEQLRRKFASPEDALKALGLDATLLAMDARRGRRRLARDAEVDMEESPQQMDAATAARFVRVLLQKLPDDERSAFIEELAELLQGMPASGSEELAEGASDNPPDLPGGGMPLPGGSMTPVRRDTAMDARQRFMSPAARSHAARFPNSARIGRA